MRERLAEVGVATAVHYPVPDHRQPAFASRSEWGDLSETERFCCEVLTLPCFPEMEEAEVDQVLRAVSSCLP